MAEADVTFVAQDVETLVKETITEILKQDAYNPDQVSQWTEHIVEEVLKKLTIRKRPYKYLVSCVIMQKNGAGLHTACSCYWDATTDGVAAVRWENRSMYCITTVFGVAI